MEELIAPEIRRREVARLAATSGLKRALPRLVPIAGNLLLAAEAQEYVANAQREFERKGEQAARFIAELNKVRRRKVDFTGWLREKYPPQEWQTSSTAWTPFLNSAPAYHNAPYASYEEHAATLGAPAHIAQQFALYAMGVHPTTNDVRLNSYLVHHRVPGARPDPLHDDVWKLRSLPEVELQPGRGPRPRPRRDPREYVIHGQPDPTSAAQPRDFPLARENVWSRVWEATADGSRGKVRPGPKAHKSSRTMKGGKEKKWHVHSNRFYLLATFLFGTLTEYADGMQALHSALPPKYQTGWYYLHPEFKGKIYWGAKGGWVWRHRATHKQMIADLRKYWGHINIHEAVSNLAKNFLQDEAIGMTNSIVRERVKASGIFGTRPVGFQTGPAL